MIGSSGSTINPYRYGGKYGYYTETYNGLILATQRWYSPHMMRWISRDPIGYEGGVNLYEYVGGRAITKVDYNGTLADKPSKFPKNRSGVVVICEMHPALCRSMPELANPNPRCWAQYEEDRLACSCMSNPVSKEACLERARIKYLNCKEPVVW